MSVSEPKDGESGLDQFDESEDILIPRPKTRNARFDTGRIGLLIDGRYRILEVVGRGGMGTVYKAEHEAIRRIVALKLLHADLAKVPEVSRRFEREAFAIGRIEHPNCVNVSDFGRLPDGALYLVMEYLEGRALSDELSDIVRLPTARTLHIVRHVLRGLGHAHSNDIVHRDVKPENVFLIEHDEDPDFAKIVDFGIAKLIGTAAQADGGGRLTQAGMAFGTPLYMSPEQALGQPIDGRADLYATSIMAFEMLTGQPPFDSEDKIEVMSMHATRPVPALREIYPDIDVPPAVEALLRRGLAKRTMDRFPNASAYIAAIEDILADIAPAMARLPTARPTVAAPMELARARTEPTVQPELVESQLQPQPHPQPQPQATTQALPPPIAPAPLTESQVQRPLPLRLQRLGKRGWMAALGVAVVIGLVAVVVLAQQSDDNDSRPSESAGSDPGADQAVAELQAKAGDLLSKGQPQQAIDLLQEHPDEVVEQAVIQLNLGHAHAALRHHEDALSAYRRALERDLDQRVDPMLRANLDTIFGDDKRPTTPVDAAGLLYEKLEVTDAGDQIVTWASKGKWLKRRQYAIEVADKLGLGDRVDRVSSLLLDLDQVKTCKERKEVVARLRAIGDPSAIDGLRKFIRPGNRCVRQDAEAAVQYLETLSTGGTAAPDEG